MNQGLMVREAQIVDDERDHQIEALKSEVRQLKAALSQANTDLSAARREATRALSALRKQLSPLYRALQSVFGELDAANISDDGGSASGATDSRVAAVWQNWKAKVGAGPGKIIDALLLHGEMNTQQLAIAIGVDRTTIPNYIHRLNQAGLINKNAGRFSLKSI